MDRELPPIAADAAVPWDRVFESAPVPLAIVGLDGRFIAANAAVRALAGLPEDGLEAFALADTVAPEDRATITAVGLTLLRGTRDTVTMEQTYVGFDDRSFRGSLTSRLLRDHDGVPVGFVGSIDDLTDLIAAQRALTDALEAKAESSRAKTAFIAQLSHDLRVPLQALAGFSELLERVAKGSATGDLAAQVHQQAQHLQAMVADLVDVSAIEAGRLEVTLEACDLAAAIGELVATVVAAESAGGLSVTCTVDPSLAPYVLTDRRRVVQAVTNLVSNAVRFTPFGSVDVEVRVVGEQIVVTVSDTGPGIAPEHLDRLFLPFPRLGQRVARGSASTGLGLTIVRQIAEALGGDVGVDSLLGVGSTFWFAIPDVAAEAPAIASAPDEHAGAPVHSATVLVVDDSDTNLLLVEQQLLALGYTPVLVPGGREAIARMDGDIDAVLMDINMPDLDGIETCRRLRALGWATPVLALTAAAMATDREACFSVGMDDFLAKPIGLDALGEAIARAIGRPSPAAISTADGGGDAVGADGGGDAVDAAAEPAEKRTLHPAVERLAADLGADLAGQVLGSVLTESVKHRGDLALAGADGNAERFRRAAHTLGSGAALVGDGAVERCARDAEHTEFALIDVDRFLGELDPLLDAMHARVADDIQLLAMAHAARPAATSVSR